MRKDSLYGIKKNNQYHNKNLKKPEIIEEGGGENENGSFENVVEQHILISVHSSILLLYAFLCLFTYYVSCVYTYLRPHIVFEHPISAVVTWNIVLVCNEFK